MSENETNNDAATSALKIAQEAEAKRQEAEAVKEAKKAERAAKAAAEKQRKATEAEERKSARSEAAEAKKVEREAAKEAKKVERETAKAERESAKSKKALGRQKLDLPEQNGIRASQPGTIGDQLWNLFDTLSNEANQPVSFEVANKAVEQSLPHIVPASVRAGYARWKKFHGLTGRIKMVFASNDNGAAEAA